MGKKQKYNKQRIIEDYRLIMIIRKLSAEKILFLSDIYSDTEQEVYGRKEQAEETER